MVLNQDQIVALRTHVAKWTGIMQSTEPADRLVAEKAISDLYDSSGFPSPEFLWSSSVRALLEDIQRWNGRALHNILTEPLGSIFSDRRSSKGRRYREPADVIKRIICRPLFQCDGSSLVLIMRGLPDKLKTVMEMNSGIICNGHEDSLVAFYEYCAAHPGHESVPADLLLDGWSLIRRACYWWFPYEGECFVSDRPCIFEIETDETFGGPRVTRIAFRDGWDVSYAVLGIPIDRRL